MTASTLAYLALAIVFEVGWAISMKISNGFTRHGYTAATVVMYLLSVVFLALATKKMDVGPAYAIWAGAGAALIAIIGMAWFKEPAGAIKLVSLGLIVCGIAGVFLSRGGH